MLLAVDVGNTQTHLGAFRGAELLEHWRFQTRAGMTGDEMAERISAFMALRGMALNDVEAVIVSSVVPDLLNTLKSVRPKSRRSKIGPIVVGSMLSRT